MNVARHHNEWLSLVEVSGPFLSLPVLLRVFPQGLDSRDPSQASRLREAYEDWLERGAKVPAVHHAWIRHVLGDVLAYPANLLAEGQAIPPGLDAVMATFSETLRPDLVLKHRETDQMPILLVSVYPSSQDLQKPVSGKLWKASPGTRMMELLHAADVPIGLVTNGEEWMLVSARRNETTGFASWYADLWMQEPLTLRAFHSLLHLRRLIGVPAPETLSGLLIESSKDQQEVTDQLGYQVRDAVEVLVQAFDRIDAESGRTLLARVDEKALYDGALTVMMRLVFLFSAEERGLLLLGDPLYDQNYAVSTLSQLLREQADQHGEEVLERRHDAWCRLLATFRAVHAGVEHEAMRLPPYGGTLFDPNRYPFLEGRAADGGAWQGTAAKPLVVNNRVVLHLLEALQTLRVSVPGGGAAEARRVSFTALDIEQIGHVYEGLLDHTAKRAIETVLGLAGSKDKQPEVRLSRLEELALGSSALLVDFLRSETGRSEKALVRLLEDTSGTDAQALMIACAQDESIAGRVRPYAGLLRRDSFGQLAVIPAGSIYVTSSTDRSSTGTHYTPRSLTEPIVRHTLEPLVYRGPADGLPQSEWTLRDAKEILALKVCDMAMGSGAFLVASCRYLAERLVEAWENVEREHPGSFVVTPTGELSIGLPAERLIPLDQAERLAVARRYVADRCLYGVDINPMAVEMAKLSLWLTTTQRDRPFSFLNHALKSGDSLLGVTSLKQIENFSLRDERQITFETADLFRRVEEASAKRSELEELPSSDFAQIEAKGRLYAQAEEATVRIKAIADSLIGLELRGAEGDAYETQRSSVAALLQVALRGSEDTLKEYAYAQIGRRHPLHWALEFPEVWAQGGFDAVVGNPPYLGAPKISGTFGADYREFLVSRIAKGLKGLADLCAYFVLRVESIASAHSCTGLVVTSAIAEGDTRAVGLQQLCGRGWKIIRATSRAPWPGVAKVTYSSIWLRPQTWKGIFVLNDTIVPGISAQLAQEETVAGFPNRLRANLGRSFNGVKVYGEGFVISNSEAAALLEKDARNKLVLFPYITTKDVNSHPAHRASAWAIRFFDWPLDRQSASPDYRGEVAADFPDCLQIVEERVKPERTRKDEHGHFVLRDPMPRLWWIYGEKRPGLYSAIERLTHVLAVGTQATKYVAFAVLDKAMVFSHSLSIVADDSFATFAVLHSSLHEVWARHYGGYNLALLRYSPTDLFETFPFPDSSVDLERLGRLYNEHRKQVMLSRNEGLTDTYNRFHSAVEASPDVARLRSIHVEIDYAVAAAYGMSDLALEHGFRETKQGIRYTLSEVAQRIVLARLLALNHQRYAGEIKSGVANKRSKSRARKEGTAVSRQSSFLE